MSADSPRRGPSSRCGGLSVPAIVPPQVVSDRSILDSAIGFINDVTLAHQPHTDPKDTITWARFESMADISDPRFGEDWELEGNVAPPLLLILGYGMGVQVWAIPANGEAIEVLSWRHGTVSALRVLPTPTIAAEDAGRRADELIDAFAEKRPLMAMCDGGSSKASGGPQPQYCAVNFVSLKTGTQVKTIKFKNAVLDILANRTSIAITFHERIAVFDARTLEDRLSITTCYPSPGINPNPVAMGSRWLAYAEHKLLHSKRSGGGCDGEGVASYTATMLNAAKSFGKGLRELGEQVAAGLTGTSTAGGSGSNSKNSSFDSNSSGDMRQAGIVTVMDIKFPIKEISPTSGTPISINGSDPFVAHFIAHSEAVVAMEFDNSGMLLVTADKRGHDFHVFRIQPHPVGSSLAAVHHLYVLHRGDTSAKVQNIACSLDSRWIAVSTLRGTTHVFPITPYGGAMGVRTHTSLHVVNKLSRFHRSAGLSAEGRSSSPISHSESTTFSQSLIPYHNPTLPPYTRPTVVLPLAQLRQPFVLGSPPGSAVPLSKSSGSAVVGSGSSQRQRLSSLSDDNGKPLSVCAIFAKSRSWLLDPPNATREAPHRIQRKAVDSLFVMAGHGALIQYDLDTKLAPNIAKEKICDETPIELEVEAKAQWNLGRKDGSQEIMPPLSTDNWLIKDRNSCMLTDSTRQFDDSDDRADSWLSQVEIITHAGPHRRLWMGPQFVFKTYNTPSGSNLSHIEAEAVEIGVSATSAAAAAAARAERSSPLNMPLSATARASVPVLIESGSYSSIEQSPKLMDRFRHEHLDSDFSVSHGDSRLKEDLADAMRESPSVSKDVTGRLLSDAAYDCAPYYDALAEHVVDDDSSYDSTHRSAAAALAHALPNIYSYAAYSSHEAPAQPRSIEKVVNPLGTVTTITAGMSSEVSTDILDEVVSQLAAEDCVIHENCDEALFRPVVAIFCDEKSRMEGEEARRQQELCKPPEVIGTKLIVPVIDKERDDELCKKEKQKTLRSGMESVASKISRPLSRAVRAEEQPLSKEDQRKFVELAQLSKKRPAETAEKETVTLSKEESRMDKKKDSGAIPKEPKVATAKEIVQTEKREEREKAQREEKFQGRDDVEQKEVGSKKMSETEKQLEVKRKNERRSSTQTEQQNRENEKNFKEKNLENDRQKEDKPVVIKKKMQKKGNGKEREQRSSEEREERKLDEAVSKEKYSDISDKEPVQTSTVELKTASVELKTSTESKVKEKAKKGQRKSEERDEIKQENKSQTAVSIKKKTQAERAEQEENQNEEETQKENKRTAQKESVEKRAAIKEPRRAEQKEDKDLSEEEETVFYIKNSTQREEIKKAAKEKEEELEENKQEKDKSAQKEQKLKKINRSQEEKIDGKRSEIRDENRAERKDEERREKRNETIDEKKDEKRDDRRVEKKNEKRAGKRDENKDENKDEKRDDENKAGNRDENKDEKRDDKKKAIKIDEKHDDKINEKKDDSSDEKKNAKKAEKKNDEINENVEEKKSVKKDATKEEHICEKKKEKKNEKYEEKNQEKNEENKDEKIYENKAVKKAEKKEESSKTAEKKLADKSKIKCLSIEIEEDDVEDDKPIEFKRMTPLDIEKPTKQTAEYAKQSANKKTADNENLSSKVKTKTNEKQNQKQMAMVESTTKTTVDETDSKIKFDKSSKSKASTTTDAIKTEQLNVADLEDSLIEIDTSHESKEVTKSKNEVEKKSMAAKVVELNEPVDIYGDAAKSTKKKKQKTHSSASNSECEEFIDVAPTKSTKAKKSIQNTAEKPARIEQKSSTSSEESFADLTESFLDKKQNISQTLFESFSEIMEKEVNTKVRKPRTDVEKVAKQEQESRKLESASTTSESTIEDNDFRLAKDAEKNKAKTKAKLEESVTNRQLSENEARKVVPTTDEGKVSKEKTKLTSAEMRENESKLNTLSSDTKSKLKVKNDEIQEPKVVVKMETALDLPVKSTTVEEKQLKETKGAIKKQIVSKKSSVTLNKSAENQQQSGSGKDQQQETGKEKPEERVNNIILPTTIKKSLADILKGEAEIIPTPIPTSTPTSTQPAIIPIPTPTPDMKKSKSKANLDTNKLPETAAAHITLPITEQPKKTKSGAPSLALEESKSTLNKKITSPDVMLDVMMTTVDSKSSAKSQNVNRTKNEVTSSSEDAEKTLLFFDKFSPEHKKSAATEPIQASNILKPVSAWQTLSGAEMISKNLAESTAAVEKNYPSLGGRVGKTNNKKTKTTTAAEDSKLITMETEIPAPSTKAIKIQKNRKELNSSNSSFDEFSMLKSFDALPPLPVLEPLEIKTCLKTPDDEVSAAIAASTESQVSLINFESPQLEHRSLAAHTSKITPTPRGFNEQNLIFALCGSLHYENESSSRERSTSDYKSLIEHINDEQYLNLEQSTLETTNKKEKSTSSLSNSSGSEDIMVVAVEQKKLTKKQQRHKQLLEQAELMKQQQQHKKEKQRRAADEDDGQADDADDDDDDDDEDDDDDDNDDDDEDEDANADNDDEELQPLISITETKLDYYINSRESRELTTHGANVELQNKKKYQKSSAAAAGGGSTTTDSEGPMAATTPSDDNNYQRGAALTTTTTGNKLKTKKLEHKINLIAAIEAATSSSTSSAEEESGVEAGGSGGGVGIVGAIEASAVVTMSATAASNAQSAPTSFQQSASKKKTKRRKR